MKIIVLRSFIDEREKIRVIVRREYGVKEDILELCDMKCVYV